MADKDFADWVLVDLTQFRGVLNIWDWWFVKQPDPILYDHEGRVLEPRCAKRKLLLIENYKLEEWVRKGANQFALMPKGMSDGR